MLVQWTSKLCPFHISIFFFGYRYTLLCINISVCVQIYRFFLCVCIRVKILVPDCDHLPHHFLEQIYATAPQVHFILNWMLPPPPPPPLGSLFISLTTLLSHCNLFLTIMSTHALSFMQVLYDWLVGPQT